MTLPPRQRGHHGAQVIADLRPLVQALRAARVTQVRIPTPPSAIRMYAHPGRDTTAIDLALDALITARPGLHATKITALDVRTDALTLTCWTYPAARALASHLAILTQPEHTHATGHTITTSWCGIAPDGHLITIGHTLTLEGPTP